MNKTIKAIEASGAVDSHGDLHLDEPISEMQDSRVRVIVMQAGSADIPEHEWLAAMANNPAFAFLDDPAEDIYSPSDGEPFDDEG